MKINRQREFQVFNTYRDIKGEKWLNLLEIIADTQSKKQAALDIKAQADPKIKGFMKSNLQAVLFQCNTKDGKSNIIEYKPFIILDFDKIPNVSTNFNNICKDVYILLAFISPSGTGIKVLIELDFPYNDSIIENIESYHQFSFEKVKEYFEQKYNLKLDESGKNINRLCYLASEQDVYFNEDCSKFETNQLWLDSLKSKPNKMKSNIAKSNNQTKLRPSSNDILTIGYEYFKENSIDAFEDYKDWLKLGFIIYNIHGKNGKDLYHRYSMLSSKYNPSDVDKQWLNISKSFDPDKVGSEKFILKRMLDFGFVIKQGDAHLKKYIWTETDLPQIQKEMGFDIVLDEITGHQFYKHNDQLELMSDPILNQILIDIRYNYSTKITYDAIFKHITSKNNMKKINFIKDKLESILTNDPTEFDKISNYITTTEGKELTSKILKRWMLGAMKNIFDTQYDEILSIKGGQGMGKTTWIIEYFLEPFNQWVSTSFYYDIKSPDQIKQLAEKMFIYDMENTSMTKAETNLIKRVTSMSTVQYRRPYDKYSTELKRIATFIMDTNEEFLYNDLTGGRRFLILTFESMNIYDKDGGELKKIDYNKVWGYIYYLYKQGQRPSNIDISELDKYRDQSRLKSDIEDIISDIFVVDDNNKMTIEEIKQALNLELLIRGEKTMTGEFNNTKIGRMLSKFPSKYYKVNNKTKKLYHISTSKYETNHSPKSKDDLFIDDILDKMNKENRSPNEEERKILEKLRNGQTDRKTDK